MKNKRNFNNLIDSVCITITFFVSLLVYFLMMWYGVANPREGTDPIATLIGGTIIFGGMTIATAIIIVKYCYGYWILLNDSIAFKRMFSKLIIIKFEEIKKVERKKATQLLQYDSEAYVICSDTDKIVAIVDGKKGYSDLESLLSKHIDQHEK